MNDPGETGNDCISQLVGISHVITDLSRSPPFVPRSAARIRERTRGKRERLRDKDRRASAIYGFSDMLLMCFFSLYLGKNSGYKITKSL